MAKISDKTALKLTDAIEAIIPDGFKFFLIIIPDLNNSKNRNQAVTTVIDRELQNKLLEDTARVWNEGLTDDEGY